MFRMDGEDHSMLVLSIRRVAQALAPRERPGCQLGAPRVGGTSNVAGPMQPQMERRKQPQIDADERRSDGISTALATERNGLGLVVHRKCAVVCAFPAHIAGPTSGADAPGICGCPASSCISCPSLFGDV
jgi:hypothetical protein